MSCLVLSFSNRPGQPPTPSPDGRRFASTSPHSRAHALTQLGLSLNVVSGQPRKGPAPTRLWEPLLNLSTHGSRLTCVVCMVGDCVLCMGCVGGVLQPLLLFSLRSPSQRRVPPVIPPVHHRVHCHVRHLDRSHRPTSLLLLPRPLRRARPLSLPPHTPPALCTPPPLSHCL